MNTNSSIEMDSQYYQVTEKIEDCKKNYDLIESIMELERELMSPKCSEPVTLIQVSYLFY